MPMLLSTVEFGARPALNALFPQHEHIAIPSVFGTPPCVLAALAFAVALALCLAWVETPICVGLVRGSAVGNDGGGRTAGRLARAGAVAAAAAVTVLIAVTTPSELRDASGRVAASSSSVERSTSSRASSSSSSHHRVPRSSSSTTRAGGGDGAGSSAHPRPVFALSPRAARALAPARSRARLRASACLAARIAAAAASSSAASSSRVDAGADLGDDAPDRLDMVASLTYGAHLTQRPRGDVRKFARGGSLRAARPGVGFSRERACRPSVDAVRPPHPPHPPPPPPPARRAGDGRRRPEADADPLKCTLTTTFTTCRRRTTTLQAKNFVLTAGGRYRRAGGCRACAARMTAH